MTTQVKNIMHTLHDAGVSVELLPDNRVSVTPAARLTDDLRRLIRDNKASIIRELEAANDQTITLGTKRPPGLSVALMAASVELDRQLMAAGYSLAVPPEPPENPLQQVKVAANEAVTPLHRNLGYFDIGAQWHTVAKA